MPGMSDTLFGPLSKEYCVWFYFLSIFGFIMLAFFLISSIMYGITKNKGVDFYMNTIAISVSYLIFYFQNRLLHSMCTA